MTARVTLSHAEMTACVAYGQLRMNASIIRGRRDNKRMNGNWIQRLVADIQGVVAEVAYAKYKGKFFEGLLDVFSDVPDVCGADIRSIDSPTKCLIIRPADKDHRIFVLGYVDGSDVTFLGWMKCSDAKHDRYWRDDAWWVPAGHLKPMKTLPPE